MTSYSITNRCPSYEVWTAEEQRRADVETFVNGACRAILDTAEATEQPNPEVETATTEAVWWHSAKMGWETSAIHRDHRDALLQALTAWADAHYVDIAALDFTARGGATPEHFYDAGYLWVFSVRGEGIGLWECGESGERLHRLLDHRISLDAHEDDDKVTVQLTMRP